MTDERGEDQPGWAVPTPTPADPGPWYAPAADSWGQPTVPAGGAPTVPLPQAAAGAPRRQRGKGWLVILLVALAATLAMAVAGTVLFATRTLPPYNGADDFLSAVKRGDDTTATNHLCSADSSDAQRAIQVVRDTMSNVNTVTVNPLGVNRTNDSARVDFTVTYTTGRTSQSYVLPMVKEGSSWKACPI